MSNYEQDYDQHDVIDVHDIIGRDGFEQDHGKLRPQDLGIESNEHSPSLHEEREQHKNPELAYDQELDFG